MAELLSCAWCGRPLSSDAALWIRGRSICPPCVSEARASLSKEPTRSEMALTWLILRGGRLLDCSRPAALTALALALVGFCLAVLISTADTSYQNAFMSMHFLGFHIPGRGLVVVPGTVLLCGGLVVVSWVIFPPLGKLPAAPRAADPDEFARPRRNADEDPECPGWWSRVWSRAGSMTRGSRVAIGIALVAMGAAWLLIPAPSLMSTCGGPWYGSRFQSRNGSRLAELSRQQAATSGGLYPASFADLRGAYDMPDPRQGLRRRHNIARWYPARLWTAVVIALWARAGVMLFRRRRKPRRELAVATLALLASAALLLNSIDIRRKTRVGRPSGGYRDHFALLFGVEEPVPAGVPLVWIRRPFGMPDRWADYDCGAWLTPAPGEYGNWQHRTDRLPWDIPELSPAIDEARGNPGPAIERARDGDATALLALAVSRSPLAADYLAEGFGPDAEIRGSGYCLRLWGLHMLNDPRTDILAGEAARRGSPEVKGYASRLLGYRSFTAPAAAAGTKATSGG